MSAAPTTLRPPICDHTWHAHTRRCWVLRHVPDLSDEARQGTLARLVEIHPGDALLISTADVTLRARCVGTVEGKVVGQVIQGGRVAVLDVGAGTLIVV